MSGAVVRHLEDIVLESVGYRVDSAGGRRGPGVMSPAVSTRKSAKKSSHEGKVRGDPLRQLLLFNYRYMYIYLGSVII